jgi:putative SOS response-associated peptidase YedK
VKTDCTSKPAYRHDVRAVQPEGWLASQIHNRMPVILSNEKAQEDWINPREPNPIALKRLLIPAPDDLLRVQPASSLVNNPKNAAPNC